MVNPKFEMLFWTSIMRDHSLFLLSALAPAEQVYIRQAMMYRDFFQQMLERIEAADDLDGLVPVLLSGVNGFIQLKRCILSGLLTCSVKINFSPSFLNHMINEALEFVSLLTTSAQSISDYTPVFACDLKLWLTDSVGHAASMEAFLDPAEGLLVEEARSYKMAFEKLLLKANELQMMLAQTGLRDGALRQLSEEVVLWLAKFNCYLDRLRQLRGSCRALATGTFIPLVPEHMMREHSYYIEKIRNFQQMMQFA